MIGRLRVPRVEFRNRCLRLDLEDGMECHRSRPGPEQHDIGDVGTLEDSAGHETVVTPLPSLTPRTEISGRCRFGGFRPASVACASSKAWLP